MQDGGSRSSCAESERREVMSASAIHPSASIAPSAKLAPGVKVGAFAVVGDGVELGDDCVLHSHAVVSGPSRFGVANVFYPFCVIGGEPQEKVEEHAVMPVEQHADAFHVAVANREHHQVIRLGFHLAPFPHRCLHL